VTAEQSARQRGHEGDPSRGWIRFIDSDDLHVPDFIGVISRCHVGAETDLVAIGGRRRNDSGADAVLQFQTTRARFGCRELGAKGLQTATRDVVRRAFRQWRPMADDHWLLGIVLLRERLAHNESIRPDPSGPWVRPGGTTFHFVNDGIETALGQAREAAGARDVRIAGGGATIVEYVNAGLIDELTIALSPVLFGSGIRLFEGVDAGRVALEPVRAEPSQRVTHLTYTVRER
jgi:hypothetical protein